MNDQIKKCQDIANCFEFMPESDGKNKQSDLPKLFLKHPIVNSVTFFGGSFNPFHEGHRACLDLCPEKNILIVPDRNPFKERGIPENVYNQFVDLAQNLKETPYSLYSGFLTKESTNPTSSWLPHVKIAEKNFLMGDDSFMSLLRWKDPDIIAKSLTKLYVVPRIFNKGDYQKMEQELLKLNPHLVVHYLGEHRYMGLSSSEIKKNLK